MTFERKSLLRWCVWFFLGQVLLFWLVGFMYLPHMPSMEWNNGTLLFVILSYLAHLGILALIPAFFFIPFAYLFPSRRIIITFAIIIATLCASLLFSDALVYNRYQFHMNGMVLTLAFHGITEDVMGLSFLEKIMPIFIIGIFLLVEWFYGRWLWRHFYRSQFLSKWVQWIAGFFVICIFSIIALFYSNVSYQTARVLIEKTRFLPLYVEFLNVLIPNNVRSFALLQIDNKNPSQWMKMENNTLTYPKNTLEFSPPSAPFNLLMIVIDTWRYDMLNEEVTPNILAFSTKSWVFSHHFSGGNSTLPGVFSLLYGMPATYLHAMEALHRGPVLLDRLMQEGYQMGIFSSAPLYTPPMNKSIFQSIKNLKIEKQPANSVLLRDQLVVSQFEQFIEDREKEHPFFGFLFFDAAHSYCGSDDMPGPFQPMTSTCNRLSFQRNSDLDLYFNRYKNAIYSIDQKISQVLHTLEKEHLLKNTIVMIVGDHGEEFDDAGRGFFGHGSNFSRYQVQTPLILYWPNETPKQISYQTSHFDIVPFLMTKLLGCRNPATDYSVGTELLNHAARPYFVISSYVNFGVIEPEKITTINPAGDYQIEKLDGEPILDETANMKVMKKVFEELQQFYRA